MSIPLIAGDKISRPKMGGTVRHIGVYLGNNYVFHNTPEKGEHASSFAEFAAGQPVQLDKRDPNVNLVQLNWRVQERLQKQQTYHWSDYNCEDAANYVLTGKTGSEQLQGWVAAAGAIALLALLVK